MYELQNDARIEESLSVQVWLAVYDNATWTLIKHADLGLHMLSTVFMAVYTTCCSCKPSLSIHILSHCLILQGTTAVKRKEKSAPWGISNML